MQKILVEPHDFVRFYGRGDAFARIFVVTIPERVEVSEQQ